MALDEQKTNEEDYDGTRHAGWSQNWFLITELVKRDFKSRYNRSVLGMFWCLLQPSLMIALQYVVFSYFFNRRVNNFPIYLAVGTVFYHFFTETTTTALQSIRTNAKLISKVKIPLWTYPTTRAASSLVNFLLSLVPLLAIVFLTHTRLQPSALLIVYSTVTLLFFSLGVGMLLASLNVFFHDIAFLWSFACHLFMYATPIFYPDTNLPKTAQLILQANPLYHYVRFSRIIIIDGVVPSVRDFATCLAFAVAAMLIGICVFRKHQNHFAQYL